MRSSNRNIRNSRALGLGAAAALLLCTAVQGAEAEHSFVFTAYSNGAGGMQLLSGDYQGAVSAKVFSTPMKAMSSRGGSCRNCTRALRQPAARSDLTAMPTLGTSTAS